jgi:hypothetical protein
MCYSSFLHHLFKIMQPQTERSSSLSIIQLESVEGPDDRREFGVDPEVVCHLDAKGKHARIEFPPDREVPLVVDGRVVFVEKHCCSIRGWGR